MATHVNPVVVIFALEREAAPFRRAIRGRDDVQVYVSGVGRRLARLATERVITAHPRLVIAAGFCGALVDGLRVGDIVMSPRIVTVDRLIASPEAKRALARETGAEAVDMESAVIEEMCREAGVPFLAVRAVSDTVDTALSPRLVKLLSGGNVSPLRAAASVVRHPLLLVEFRRLARDSTSAARNLASALLNAVSREPESSEASAQAAVTGKVTTARRSSSEGEDCALASEDSAWGLFGREAC